MGIPHLLNYLIQFNVKQYPTKDYYLLIDGNCFIHLYASKYDFVNSILSLKDFIVDSLISKFSLNEKNPKKILFLDGKTKFKQKEQQKRTSILKRFFDKNDVLFQCEKLELFDYIVEKLHDLVEINTHKNFGEGEFKLKNYFKNINYSPSIIYTFDTDTFMYLLHYSFILQKRLDSLLFMKNFIISMKKIEIPKFKPFVIGCIIGNDFLPKLKDFNVGKKINELIYLLNTLKITNLRELYDNLHHFSSIKNNYKKHICSDNHLTNYKIVCNWYENCFDSDSQQHVNDNLELKSICLEHLFNKQ